MVILKTNQLSQMLVKELINEITTSSAVAGVNQNLFGGLIRRPDAKLRLIGKKKRKSRKKKIRKKKN